MATKPVKTTAAEAVVELLRGVTVKAGRHTNLGRNTGRAVDRRVQLLNALRPADFPAASVLMGEAKPAETRCLGPGYREVASIVVLLYAKAEDIPAELERLEADAKAVVCGSASLGGVTGRPVHVSSIPYYQQQENVDRGMVEVTFAVEFDWTAAAP